MNQTAELVRLWAKYEEEHENAGIEGFCQAYLAKGGKQKKVAFWKTPTPPDTASVLTKLIGRIARLHSIDAMAAFKDCGIGSFDEFLYLNSIKASPGLRKTDVIYANFNELSSGLLILERLKTNKLVGEQLDAEDRRSKRLELTKKGNATLMACYDKLRQINELSFDGTTEDQVKLCIQMLKPIETTLSKKWFKEKRKTIVE